MSVVRTQQYQGSTPPVDQPAEGFVGWVIQQAGLKAGLYRHRPLLRRLVACLRALRVRSTEEAQALLEKRPDLLPLAVNSLLIGVTEFFRDATVFAGLRTEVLPQLAAGGRPLRVWSAGCSTGEELYSVAILLAEAGLLPRSELLGSDCRSEVVAHARLARYRATAVQGIEPATVRNFFAPTRDGYQVIELLRRQTRWQVADMAETVAAGPWDLILWRNLAIYFNRGPTETLWKRLVAALSPQGFLIVGKAERPPTSLGLKAVCRSVYRKQD